MSEFFFELRNSLTQFLSRGAEVGHLLTEDLLLSGEFIHFYYEIILDHV